MALWAGHRRNAVWLENTSRLRIFIPNIGTDSPEMARPRTAWVRLIRPRTDIRRFLSCIHKWGMAPFVVRERGAEEQTA